MQFIQNGLSVAKSYSWDAKPFGISHAGKGLTVLAGLTTALCVAAWFHNPYEDVNVPEAHLNVVKGMTFDAAFDKWVLAAYLQCKCIHNSAVATLRNDGAMYDTWISKHDVYTRKGQELDNYLKKNFAQKFAARKHEMKKILAETPKA